MNSISLFDFFFLVLLSVLGAIAQLFLKASAQSPSKNTFELIFDPLFFFGGFLLVLNTIGTVYLLRTLPLILVTPLMSIIYFFAPLGAIIIFKERVSGRFWLGSFFIMCGIAVIVNS